MNKAAQMGGPPHRLLDDYDPDGFYCELCGRNGRKDTKEICRRLNTFDLKDLRRRAREADRELFNLGITFTVYSDRDAIDRVLPFDFIPRVLSRADWANIESGGVADDKAIYSYMPRIIRYYRTARRVSACP